MALAGHVSRAMMERYSHIRMEAKRRAVDDLCGTDFEPGVAQNWAQFFVSEKSDEANSLKTVGEPGRTRTSNPLIVTRNAKYSMFQAVSSFRECQKWSDLGVIVIKDVMKFLGVGSTL